MSKKKKPSPGKGASPKPAGKTSSHKHELFLSLFIFAFAFLLYANTFTHDYALDDDVVYRKNTLVQKGVSGLKDIFTHSFIYGFTGHNDQSYRPVVQMVYAFEKSMFDDSPHTQHVINVLFFAICCLLLYKLMQKMLRKFGSPSNSAGWFSLPFVVTLLFAAHPVHTESVANIKGLDDILNFFFLILSLHFIFDHVESGKKRHLVLSLLAFFLSLLCKEAAVTYVILIPLTIFFFTGLPVKTVVKHSLFFVGTLFVYYMVRKSVLDVVTFQEKMQVMNNALAAAQTGSDRLATALLILGKYIQLLFFPHPLSFDYSYNQIPIVSFADPVALVTVIILLALGGYAAFILFKALKERPEARTLAPGIIPAYSILFFFLSIAVVSNIFILIGATMGERFLFTPSLAFCMAVPFILQRFGKNVMIGAVTIILVLFSYKTYSRNFDWKDNASLFAAAVEATPNSSRVQSSMGSSYREMGEKELDPVKRVDLFKKALPYYEKAIEILPANTEALYNAGVCYYNIGDNDAALKVYKHALEVTPGYTNAANNAGVIYFNRKDYENAKKCFQEVLKYDPNHPDALGNLGAINHNQGNMKEAIEYYKRALAINPNNQNVRNNLAKAEGAGQGQK